MSSHKKRKPGKKPAPPTTAGRTVATVHDPMLDKPGHERVERATSRGKTARRLNTLDQHYHLALLVDAVALIDDITHPIKGDTDTKSAPGHHSAMPPGFDEMRLHQHRQAAVEALFPQWRRQLRDAASSAPPPPTDRRKVRCPQCGRGRRGTWERYCSADGAPYPEDGAP